MNLISMRRCSIFLFLILTTILAAGTRAQEFSNWSNPVNLGPTINSGASEQHPAISKDGLSLYFSSDRTGTEGGLDIWVSQRRTLDDPWGTPQNLGSAINTGSNDLSPSFSPDGHWMYFHSDRANNCGGGTDLYVSHRKSRHDDFGWEAAVDLGCVVNSSSNDEGPTFYHDRETNKDFLYFTSNRPGGPGDFDIYVSSREENDECNLPDGEFGPPVRVDELSSPYRETRTAIRKDGLEMFITSVRPGSILSSAGALTSDIWVSTRESTEDPWSTPVNLGEPVNGAFTDGAPALSDDGTALYFYSNRPGGLGGNDLWVATRTRLHRKHRKDGDHDADDDDKDKDGRDKLN